MRQSRDGHATRWFPSFTVRLTAVAAFLCLGACTEWGLPDRNLPRADALQREYGFEAYRQEPRRTVSFAGRQWLMSGAPADVQARLLQPVGTAGAATLYALRWDQAPYDRLYTAEPAAGWRALDLVH